MMKKRRKKKFKLRIQRMKIKWTERRCKIQFNVEKLTDMSWAERKNKSKVRIRVK